MSERQIVIDNPSTLVMWLGYNEPEKQISESDAQILLNYMEGHDYSLLVVNDQLMRRDIAEEDGEIQPYGIDDVIDIVCEWNYELMYDAKFGMEHPKDFIDYCNYSDSLDALKEDVPVLDRLFEQTKYGKWKNEIVETVIAKSSVPGLKDMTYITHTPVAAKSSIFPEREVMQGKVR